MPGFFDDALEKAVLAAGVQALNGAGGVHARSGLVPDIGRTAAVTVVADSRRGVRDLADSADDVRAVVRVNECHALILASDLLAVVLAAHVAVHRHPGADARVGPADDGVPGAALLPDPRLLAGRDRLVVVVAADVMQLDPAEQVYPAVDVDGADAAVTGAEDLGLPTGRLDRPAVCAAGAEARILRSVAAGKGLAVAVPRRRRLGERLGRTGDCHRPGPEHLVKRALGCGNVSGRCFPPQRRRRREHQ